jgi:hypothetical protein
MAGIEVELSDVHAAMRKNVGNVTCMADTAMRRPAGMRPQSRWHCGHIICNPFRRQQFRRQADPAFEGN